MKKLKRSSVQWFHLAVALFTLTATCTLVAQDLVQTNTLSVGEAQIFPASGSNVVVATEGIVRALPAGPGKLVVSAVKNGRTDMLVLDDAGKTTQRYAFLVAEHSEAKQTFLTSLDEFRKIVKQMVGPHKVEFDVMVGPFISFDGTNVVSVPKPVLFIHGEAKDEIEADTIRDIASRYYGRGTYGSTSQQAQPNTTNMVTSVITDLKSDPNIVDQMTIARHHQVRIRVQVAEVNTSAAKKKGIQYSDNVTWGVGGAAPSIASLQQGGAAVMARNVFTGLVIPGGGSSEDTPAFQATLQLLLSEGYARLLSEPTLVAKSGQKASFLAGGKLLQTQSSTLVGQGGAGNFRTEEFGVRLRITPVVDRAEHLDMSVFTEVSEAPQILSDVNAIITTRNSETALRMNSGDTLVLSGLLQNNFRNSIRKIPALGQIPVLGALFRSKDWQSGQTELLFFITPEIIRELPQDTLNMLRTPVMKQWIHKDAHKDILPDPNSHAGPDNDVHDLFGLPPDRVKSVEPEMGSPVVPPGTVIERPAIEKPAATAPLFPATAPAAPVTAPPVQKPERKYR